MGTCAQIQTAAVSSYYTTTTQYCAEVPSGPAQGPHAAASLNPPFALGNDELIKYSLSWWASLVQHPEKKLGVSMVYKGAQGELPPTAMAIGNN